MAEGFRIRRAEPKDAAALAEIERECFDDPWSLESLERELCENGMANYLVAEDCGEAVGYAGFWFVADEAQIMNVAIRQAYRRRGFGRLLLEELLSEAKKKGAVSATLEVRTSNEAAIALYEDFGFRAEYIRLGYYGDGEDAYVMDTWL